MNEEENPQRDSQAEPQAQPETTPTDPNASMPSKDAGWAGASPTRVMRTVATALLTTAVVLGAFFLLWQVAPSSAGSSSPSFWRRCSTRRSTGCSADTGSSSAPSL